ncbi:serine/threonine protein kinase [Nocardia huaxiensis]|uniref:non-specific serine/threonine protein kinase n=1 Tax=Nocardia huaxiensis TaxID=2755382 RepID=A0A7D6V6V8_9NOCA|nr:serine/threonine-protein kinase [Nocardia huaxiensis]QLY27851.1 serine/threonine protein kinase [Nocardia huaxiensis]
MELAEGMVFAGYRIERKLGAGSSGTVYLAQHPRLPRKDALKILFEGSGVVADLPGKFLRDADLAARLNHPNLVAVRDRGVEGGRLWIAMQYVHGPDLAELIRWAGGGLDPARVVAIIAEAAQGIDEIHSAGLLHRDVKPANILVAAEPGATERVYITDYGIGAALADSVHGIAPAEAATPAYAAPERIRAETIDHRADVYALGCTLFHALTGTAPFPRDNTAAIMYAHLHEAPPRVSDRKPGVAPGFDSVVARAMAKDPRDRYASCGELAAAAVAALTASVPDSAGSGHAGPGAGQRNRRRYRLPIALGAAVILLASVIGLAVAFGAGESGRGVESRVAVPVTGTTEAREWGEVGYIVTAFPDVLPPLPGGAGYQDVTTCFAAKPGGERVLLTTKLPVAELNCVGDLNPVWNMTITCNADRTPILPDELLAEVEGHESWRRGSGSGNIFWGRGVFPEMNAATSGKAASILDVYFDDPSRNFCRMRVFGDLASGSELRTRWWLGAPV